MVIQVLVFGPWHSSLLFLLVVTRIDHNINFDIVVELKLVLVVARVT